MPWKFAIHIDDPDNGATTWEAALAPPSESFWAIGPPPGDESDTWLIGLHFVVRDGYPILVGQQMILNEPRQSMETFAPWLGDTESVPEAGLSSSALHALALDRMQNQVRAALADRWHSTWGDGRRDAYDDGEPPDNMTEHSAVAEATRVDVDRTAQPEKRGRPALSDELLAEVAYHYGQALLSGEPVTRYVETQMAKGGEALPVSQWVLRARRHEFLTPATKPGKPGGTITAKAIATLKRSGFLDDQGDRAAIQEEDGI